MHAAVASNVAGQGGRVARQELRYLPVFEDTGDDLVLVLDEAERFRVGRGEIGCCADRGLDVHPLQPLANRIRLVRIDAVDFEQRHHLGHLGFEVVSSDSDVLYGEEHALRFNVLVHLRSWKN